MVSRRVKSLLVAAFSLLSIFFSNTSYAQELNPSSAIMEHISDAHEFHILTFHKKPVSIPLPVILYSKEKGWSIFMSSRFEHGEQTYDGYRLVEESYIKENKLDANIFKPGKIYAADADGKPLTPSVAKVYDFSLGRNAVQVLISVVLLIWVMSSVAAKYKTGKGVKTAPTGFQNAVEPVITFIRDDVAKPNLGDKYEKFMPLLLCIFFFILINSLLSLIPGTANVAGNIAFTGMLGIIAFFVIMFSTNKHYWLHIVWPPVPHGVKIIMWPVEILGIFTKPFALIIRLFANMISGHVIILSFIILIFIFGAMNTGLGWGTSPFFIALAVFIYLIEILVAFIQAYIFAALTAVFVGMAFEGGHEEHGEHHEDAVLV
jgi:F-type H+-transporting ATPase subunit a